MAKVKNTDLNLRHVAIIMDGNGRWAKQRGLKHLEGHKEGSEAVRRTIEAARQMKLEFLTLYAFSTENWRRSKTEVSGLMRLLREFVDLHLEEIKEKGLRVRAIGRLEGLPLLTRRKLNKAIKETENNKGGTVIFALNYGGRAEIVDAAKKIAQAAQDGSLNPKNLTEDDFANFLYAPDVPDPELLIRTSGECRLSNFLLWELSYSEIYISNLLWPDFGDDELKRAIADYNSRNRRFGGRKKK